MLRWCKSGHSAPGFFLHRFIPIYVKLGVTNHNYSFLLHDHGTICQSSTGFTFVVRSMMRVLYTEPENGLNKLCSDSWEYWTHTRVLMLTFFIGNGRSIARFWARFEWTFTNKHSLSFGNSLRIIKNVQFKFTFFLFNISFIFPCVLLSLKLFSVFQIYNLFFIPL